MIPFFSETVDTTEYMFKLALVQGNKNHILQIIKTCRLVGESIIAYLQQKGYPEIALHFVEDSKTKFLLALECGDLDIAYTCAEELKDDDSWLKLGQAALEQGDFEVQEAFFWEKIFLWVKISNRIFFSPANAQVETAILCQN